MVLRLPAALHSWQASSRTFRTHSLAPPFARDLGCRNQLFDSFQRPKSSNGAHGSARSKARIPERPKKETPKPSQNLNSGSRKPAAYEPLAEKLALRVSPTLLYRDSSHTSYLFGCYVVGGGLLAAAWFNFQTQFYVQPGGVPSWVPVFTTVGSFMIACGGFWMLLKPQNLVRAISCLPPSAKAGLGSKSLLLQIERTPILPFKQRKPYIVPPGDVTISSPVFNDDAQRKLEATIAEIAWREDRLRAFAKTNLLTLPFRQAGYWMWRAFVGIRSAFTGGGFHQLHVRGNNRVWKLGKDPAWALENGKALDKLVKIKLG